MNIKMTTTQWSRVLAARGGSDTKARAALEDLCRIYWEPLYAFARRQGAPPDEAEDLTQGYFAELLEKDFLSSVDPAKGRFRSFLFASFKHYHSHERERTAAVKRGGRAVTVSLDVEGAEKRYAVQPSEEMSPEQVFEYRWAVTMLNRAVERLRRDSSASGRAEQFEVLRQYLTSAAEQTPYREAARRLGTSEGAVKMAVSRLRNRLGQCLRAEVADTVADPSEIDDEVRQLLEVLRS